METYFDVIDINKNNAKDVTFENVCAVKVTSGGGMGDCGGIYFLCLKDGIKYYYLNFIDDEPELVSNVLNNFYKPFADEIKEKGGIVWGEYKDWKLYGMGMGNYLIVKNKYVEDFERIGKSNPIRIIDNELSYCPHISIGKVFKLIYDCFKDKN